MFRKKIISLIKKSKFLYSLYLLLIPIKDYFNFRIFSFVKDYYWFFSQIKQYNRLNNNPNFNSIILYPCLMDKTNYTPVEPIYFWQDVWFAKHLFKYRPEVHCDIGSSYKTISIIAQFTKVIFVDIRPPSIIAPNVEFIEGDILNLPFKNESFDSLSSLCVIEHIGLGRYGDTIDPYGSEKAINELKRVLRKGGLLYLSIPVDNENKIYFNAHRAFTRDYLIELFKGFEILDEKYIYGSNLYDIYLQERGFGTGLYLLQKKGG